MTAAIATEEERRVALAMSALVLGAIAMRASVLPGGLTILFGIYVGRPRAQQFEAGP